MLIFFNMQNARISFDKRNPKSTASNGNVTNGNLRYNHSASTYKCLQSCSFSVKWQESSFGRGSKRWFDAMRISSWLVQNYSILDIWLQSNYWLNTNTMLGKVPIFIQILWPIVSGVLRWISTIFVMKIWKKDIMNATGSWNVCTGWRMVENLLFMQGKISHTSGKRSSHPN